VIVAAFKKSALKKERMERVQAQLRLERRRLVMDVVTRWNSTLYMLASAVNNQVAIDAIASEDGHMLDDVELMDGDVDVKEDLTESDWMVAERLVEVSVLPSRLISLRSHDAPCRY
jgi:hypothetical protein